MDVNNLTNVYNQNPTLQGSYTLPEYLALFGQGATTPPTATVPPIDPNSPTTPLNSGIINSGINQYQNQGGDKQGGGGAFGNLDISDVKTFQKDVYNEKTGKFEQQTVTGYKNPNIGNYQTFKGKNINHGGIAFKGIAGMAMDMMGLGPEVDENGYYDGQISGTFTGFKPSDFKNIKSFYKAKKDRQTFMDNNKIEIDRIEKERLREEVEKINAAASRAESARQYDATVHGPNNYGLGSDGNQSYDSGQGFGTNATSGGPVSNRTGRGRTDYKDGGATNGSGKAALSAKVKELMDDGYEFGEAVKEAMKQGYMNGGRIKSYFKGGLVSLRGR